MEILSNLMIGAAALAAAASASLLGHGLYQGCLGRLIAGVRDESPGGLKGAGRVLVRRLGVLNRRIMTPAYAARVRKGLVKGGEPQGYQPEEILALQELCAVVGLL